jgi:hypothetical protein
MRLTAVALAISRLRVPTNVGGSRAQAHPLSDGAVDGACPATGNGRWSLTWRRSAPTPWADSAAERAVRH